MPVTERYKNIIVGVDGSDASSVAFTEAVYIAKRNDSKLYVVQVINNVANYLPDSAMLELKSESEERYDRLSEQANNMNFNNMESIIIEGSPKKILANTLPEKYDIDLLVLGATGRHFISESLLGSIAHYATTNASCNVMIVR